jgi:TolB-like protein/Tfp pilus assembly protein PilF
LHSVPRAAQSVPKIRSAREFEIPDDITGPPDPESVAAALERVLSDPEVGANPRRAKLLRHLVEETLAGRTEGLRGTAIAMDVFGRGADFDPQTDAIVRAEARRLRQALASYYAVAGARDPVAISIPKGGYVPQFSIRTGAVDAAAPGGSGRRAMSARVAPTLASSRDLAESPPSRGRGLMRPRMVVGPTLLAGLALVIGAVSWFAAGARGGNGRAPMTPSVLVAPFEATGEADDIEALASGVTARLISDLMRFPDFRVYSFEDSLHLKEDPASPVDRDDTGFVVRGVVQGDADALSVMARLVRTTDGAVIWSDAFSRPLEPNAIVAMQAEISGAIAAKIAAPDGVLRAGIAEDVAASAGMRSFACVMRAYTYRHANRRDLYAPVRTCLDEAVARDPDYAEAWAMLAFLRLDGGRFGYEAKTAAERSQAYAAARAAAARALSLDPRNVLAATALAQIEHYAGHFEQSLGFSRQALEANPNDPNALALHGWRLSLRGDFDEGVAYLKRAIERSVKPPAWLFHPIALARLAAGDFEGMLVAAERAATDDSAVSQAFLAIAHGKLGHRDEARAALDRMARGWPLLGRDPAAAFGVHNVRDDLIAMIVEGLRAAGWTPPSHAAEPS